MHKLACIRVLNIGKICTKKFRNLHLYALTFLIYELKICKIYKKNIYRSTFGYQLKKMCTKFRYKMFQTAYNCLFLFRQCLRQNMNNFVCPMCHTIVYLFFSGFESWAGRDTLGGNGQTHTSLEDATLYCLRLTNLKWGAIQS